MSTPTHVAVLLAAGASHRLGQPKALVEVDGEALVARTARLLLGTAPRVLLVVTGEAQLAAQIAHALDGLEAHCVSCPDWRLGMGASLRAGLFAAAGHASDGVLVCPCDLPRLTSAHLEALMTLWAQVPGQAAACRYGEVVGTPAVLPKLSQATIAAFGGDRGARDWLRAQPDLRCIEAPALAFDLDRPTDLPA